MSIPEFEHPNFNGGFRCPVCKTSADAPVVLVPVPEGMGTGIFVRSSAGKNVEVGQMHAECYRLVERMQAADQRDADRHLDG